ncbi:MAG: hypothetical protein IJ851_03890 [Eubacterium sp.]|nr:hypothetical protein [Eubacterium sp.]
MDTYEQFAQLPVGAQIVSGICAFIVVVLSIIANWKLFEKAGEAGWKAIIPIYNIYILCKIVDGNGWKFLLLIIPVVNFVYTIILNLREAKAYGKGVGFGIGLIFFPTIFTLILGFGSAQYVGPKGQPKVQ